MNNQPLEKYKEPYTKRYLLFMILQRLEGRLHTKVEGLRSDMNDMFAQLAEEDMEDRFTSEYLEKEFDDIKDILVSALKELGSEEINKEIKENDLLTILNFWRTTKEEYCKQCKGDK